MSNYPKRLIEVDLLIKRISEHTRKREPRGRLATLHAWWARKPSSACRAVICATLWPDPADLLCPDPFRETARALMKKWATDHLALLSAESIKRFIGYQKNPEKLHDNTELRQALLDFIADFANWDNSTVKEYLDTARILTRIAHVVLTLPDFQLPISDLASDSAIRNLKSALENLPRPLVVDSFAGGGSIPLEALRVGASQEIYESILKFREKTHIPVVASMGDVTASGGVYVAMAVDKILANPGTVTGSIGVIIQSRNLSRLLDKVGVSAEVVKSGRYKDTLSMYRGLTKPERALLQGVIDDSHEQFVEVGARGRKLTAKAVREFADGRVMTGRQAKKVGLVDELGGFEVAVATAKNLAGITEKPQFIELAKPKRKWWERITRRFINLGGGTVLSSLPEGVPLYVMPHVG